MKKPTSWMSAAASALFVLAAPALALASSHREAPAIANDPAADNTDLYAWVEGGNLIIIANYIPLEEPAGGPNFHGFSDDVLYEIHIVRGPSSLEDVLTYQLSFDTKYPAYIDPNAPKATPASGQEFFSQISGAVQTYQLTKIVNGKDATTLVNGGKIAPPNIGPRTNALAYGIPAGTTYEQFFVGGTGNAITSLGSGEGRAFVGPRDDGFYVDLGAVFDLAGLRPVVGGVAVDNVAGYNTHSIALEIPLKVANGADVKSGPSNEQTIGVWASASRRKTSILRKDNVPDVFGPWRQVSRLGLPLINEAVIGLQDKDRWNRLTPRDDVKYFAPYFFNPILVRDAEFAGFYKAGGPLATCAPDATALAGLKSNRTDIIGVINLALPALGGHTLTTIGDVLRVDLGTTSGFPNGRTIAKGTNVEGADVTNVELNLLLCKLGVPATFSWDGVNHNDATFRADFPVLATPWEGFSQGHGKAAP